VTRWGGFLLRRLALVVVSLWALVTVSFLLVSLLPTDPARAVAGEYATDEQIAEVAAQLGLDQPLIVRYGQFLSELLRGSLGADIYSGEPVTQEIAERLPSTLELIILSMIVAAVVGLTLGVLGAYFHRNWQDRVSSGVVAVLQAVPDFVIAVVFLYVFFHLLGWLPGPEGQLSIAATRPPTVTGMLLIDTLLAGQWDTFWDAVRHAVLPSLALGLALGALFARVSRVALREALESEQTRFARACGLSEGTVIRYAMLTSRTPILTYGAIMFASLVGGTAIIETVFNWNGVSQWSVQAMLTNNYPSILGFIVVAGTITLLVYVFLDVLTGLLDPRIRLAGSRR
jgi:ABC-type dipeptide/oligopeptide/nickel transport system permease component